MLSKGLPRRNIRATDEGQRGIREPVCPRANKLSPCSNGANRPVSLGKFVALVYIYIYILFWFVVLVCCFGLLFGLLLWFIAWFPEKKGEANTLPLESELDPPFGTTLHMKSRTTHHLVHPFLKESHATLAQSRVFHSVAVLSTGSESFQHVTTL